MLGGNVNSNVSKSVAKLKLSESAKCVKKAIAWMRSNEYEFITGIHRQRFISTIHHPDSSLIEILLDAFS